MSATTTDRSALRLWLAVAAGFALLAGVWTVMFTVAHRAQVQSVPLAGAKGGTKP